MFQKPLLVLTLLIAAAPSAFAVEVGGFAAHVRGPCFQEILGKKIPLHEGDTVPAGAIVSTGSSGEARVLLQDHSSLELGPLSSIRLEPAKGDVPQQVSMGGGVLRAKITKDYATPAGTKPKIKFFLKTRSATMGVRGTEFEVIDNPRNQITSLLTFEGAVSMASTKPGESPQTISDAMAVLNGSKAVLVTEGRFSAANPSAALVSTPVKISPSQFAVLKASGAPFPISTQPSSFTPKALSPIPPGVDPKAFAPAQAFPASKGSSAPPEGFFDRKTGAYAPPAGGFLDMKSGLYVPPPPGSAYDPDAGVFIPPTTLGTIDPKSGAYVPPAGFQLDPNKGFVPVGPGTPVSGAKSAGMPILVGAILPGSAVPSGPATAIAPAGLPDYSQPAFPTQDPYCPQCTYPQNGPAVPTTTTVRVTFTTF